MTPIQMSAQFAAYIWFRKQDENFAKADVEAHQFARRNWEHFLPSANEGFGRLLMRIVSDRDRPRRLKIRPTAVAASV